MIWGTRTLLAAVVLGVGSVLIAAAGAYADSPHLTLEPTSGPPGSTVTARGAAFCPTCGPVEIDFVVQPVKQGIVVGSDGSFQTTFMVPGGAQAGTNAVNVYQQGQLVTQTSFNVTPSAPPPTTTPTPRQSAGPTSSPSGQPSHGGSPSPGSSATPPATPSRSGGGAGTSLLGQGGGPTAAVLLVALAALVVVAAGVVVLYLHPWSRGD